MQGRRECWFNGGSYPVFTTTLSPAIRGSIWDLCQLWETQFTHPSMACAPWERVRELLRLSAPPLLLLPVSLNTSTELLHQVAPMVQTFLLSRNFHCKAGAEVTAYNRRCCKATHTKARESREINAEQREGVWEGFGEEGMC